MKILVTVKEVAEPDDDFAIEDTDIAASDLEYDLNEWDDYAIEAAVQLAEAGIADEVVTVTIGPERAEETIRMALAKGADRAVRVWDDAFEAGFADVAAKVTTFEAVVDAEEPDLILGGVQAADTGFGATGRALAERIGFEHAAVVNDLEVDADAGVAHVHRELEGGIEELTDVDLPAVLTVQTGLNEPRATRASGASGRRSARRSTRRTSPTSGCRPTTSRARWRSPRCTRAESESNAEIIDGDAGRARRALPRSSARRGERVMSDVLVVSEHRRGELRDVSYEAITAGREIADARVATFTSR